MTQVIAESRFSLVGYLGALRHLSLSRHLCSLVRLRLPRFDEDQFKSSGYIWRKSIPRNVTAAMDSAFIWLRGYAEQVGP